MATFFAVCNVNGPISVEINASDLDQAVAEFEAMDARELIDDARTDAEDELGLDGQGKSEDEFESMLLASGCQQVKVLDVVNNYHAGTTAALLGGWSIWQVVEQPAATIKENVPAVEVCSNIEWVRENDFWHRDDIDESDMDDAVRTYQQSIYNDLTDKGWDVAWAKNQRMLYHGWNGAHFATKCSVVGSVEKLTDEQVAVIDQVREKAAELVKQTWVKTGMFFEFKTDSESGKIKADSYEDACEKLRDMVGDDHEATGAWGWVEDQDGNRLEIGEVP